MAKKIDFSLEQKQGVKTSKVCLTKSVWVDKNGTPVKVDKGTVVNMTDEQIKHFGKAVTKDLPASEGDE